jgi:hypothetical protein
MPIDEGWRVVKEALDKIYNPTDGFVYPEPLKSVVPIASERAREMVFQQLACQVGYAVTPREQSNELVFWHLSLMFVEYVAGMLSDKAGKHCRNGLHPKPCPESEELHHQMLRRLIDDLERLTNEIRTKLPLKPGVDRIPGSWELPK